MTNNTDTAKDLREVYLHTYANFATSPTEVADQFKGINLRYARELLSTLVEAGLVAKTEDGEGSDAWQTIPTYDDMDETEAASKIDEWLKKHYKASAPKAKPEQTFHACYCGCGENVPTKSFYRPGHDARHAGTIGREIAANYHVKGFDRRDLLSNLPSDKLVAKAEGIAEKQIEKIEAKAKREAEREEAKAVKAAAKDDLPDIEEKGLTEGSIRVGKNEYVAYRKADGTVTYFGPKGEEKVASKTAAATFTE